MQIFELIFHLNFSFLWSKIPRVLYGTGFFRGINLANCINGQLDNNTIINNQLDVNGDPAAPAIFGSYGISLANCTNGNPIMTGNTTNGFGIGLAIQGNCSSPNGYVGNTFMVPTADPANGKGVGLFVGEGAQMGAQSCTGNQWIGTFSPHPSVGGAARNIGVPAASQFTVDFASSTENPQPRFPAMNWFFDGCTSPRIGNFTTGERGLLSLFPNPADDKLTFSNPFSEEESIEIRVFNLAGKLLLQREIDNPNSRVDIQLDAIPSGTYLFQAISNEDSFVKKFVKQ